MSRIRATGSRPERAVLAILRSLRFKPQLHRTDLPGVPDLVLHRKKIAILVHGCFWHRHSRCRFAYTPKSNVAFWKGKFEANTCRDRVVRRQLAVLGWTVLVVWECELRSTERLRMKIKTAAANQPD